MAGQSDRPSETISLCYSQTIPAAFRYDRSRLRYSFALAFIFPLFANLERYFRYREGEKEVKVHVAAESTGKGTWETTWLTWDHLPPDFPVRRVDSA